MSFGTCLGTRCLKTFAREHFPKTSTIINIEYNCNSIVHTLIGKNFQLVIANTTLIEKKQSTTIYFWLKPILI